MKPHLVYRDGKWRVYRSRNCLKSGRVPTLARKTVEAAWHDHCIFVGARSFKQQAF